MNFLNNPERIPSDLKSIAPLMAEPWRFEAENFQGAWAHGSGTSGAFNWFIIGTGTQGKWSDASNFPGFPGGPNLYANNGAFFVNVAQIAAASIANMNGVVFDFSFKTDYLGATTAARYFIGQRNQLHATTETGRRGAFCDLAAGDTQWYLLHETSAGVQTKIPTGKAYAANKCVHVTLKLVSATETQLTICTEDSPTPVTVSSATGFTVTGNVGLGFQLHSTTAANRFMFALNAILAWPAPTL